MIDIQEFKYKGVSLPFKEAPTTGGHRIVKYLYPGSDKQSVEIQGRAPRVFQIVGVIPHDNYYNIRDAIIEKLEDGKKGILIHPTFGEVDNVVCSLWAINEVITELGRAEITIAFEIDDAKGTPEKIFNVKSIIEKSVSDAMKSIEDTIAEHIDIASIRQGIDIAGQVVDSARDAVEFATKIKVSLESPALFASSFGGIFADISGIYEDSEQAFNAFERLFVFGDNIGSINPVNESSINQKSNTDILVASVKAASLAYAYLSSVDIEFSTSEEVAEIHKKIEAQYLSIRGADSISTASPVKTTDISLVAPEILQSIEIVRIEAIAMLDTIAVALPRVFTVDVSSITPLSVLVYSFYGNTDLFDAIAELNNIRDNAFVQGEIRLLSA